ncbi:MAG: hypothetical protein KGM17_15315 [Sphingomonadales bacterium]|nr:hypothetical protein [Sphingomonadales bacterium]
MPAIALSSIVAHGVQRECPRPLHLRNAAYAGQFDWDTVCYDVYRAGRHVVFQGPPFANFAALLADVPALHRRGFPLWPRWRRIDRLKAGEIWLRSDAARIALPDALGGDSIAVQPDMSSLFAGRRVIHTLSKNNDLQWIVDWVRFYVSVHGADGVLIHDNASTDYAAADIEAALRRTFPAIALAVVSWPFRYGPQGGLAGAVDGVETPWDSDFCQTGSLQHARHRFLRTARSVLNVDIDELVLSDRGRSIFAATEQSRAGFIKFAGSWIVTATPHPVPEGLGRHADFTYADSTDTGQCPPKWCIVPGRHARSRVSWSVHNLFGSRANRVIDREFRYRHMKGISNGWKYRRWDDAGFDSARHRRDDALAAAMSGAGLQPAAAGALSPACVPE